MSEIISFGIAGIFLYVYLILSSIEFGSSFFLAFPNITSHKEIVKLYLSPIWEITNVFLVLFALSLFVFFPGLIASIDPLIPILIIALALLAIRVISILYIYLSSSTSMIFRWILFVVSFAAPIVLSQVFLFMLTGVVQPLSLSSLFMALFVTAIMVSLSVAFFKVLAHQTYKKNLYTILGISLAVLISSINGLVLTLMYPVTQLLSHPTVNIVFCSLSSIVLIILFFAYSRKKTVLLFSMLCVLIAILLGTFFAYQLPYLIYPTVTIYETFTNPTVFPWLLGSFITAFVFVVPTIVLLYTAFIFKTKLFNN